MGRAATRKAKLFHPHQPEVTENQRFQVIEACGPVAPALEHLLHPGVEVGLQLWRPAMQLSRMLKVLRLSLGGSILAVSVAILAGFVGYESSIVAAVIGFGIAAGIVLIADRKFPDSHSPM